MSFTPSLPEVGSDSAKFHIKQVLEKGILDEERNKRYDNFSATYDEAMRETKYSGARMTAQTAGEYITGDKRQLVTVLDVGAGTGLVGEELVKLGFTVIDALEPSEQMLQKAREKNIYRSLMHDEISDKQLDISGESYDVITIAGSHGASHIKCDAIMEILRLLKKGGIVCIVTRMETVYNIEEYKDRFFPMLNQLEQEGRCKKREVSSYPDFFPGIEGVKIIYEKL